MFWHGPKDTHVLTGFEPQSSTCQEVTGYIYLYAIQDFQAVITKFHQVSKSKRSQVKLPAGVLVVGDFV